MKFNKIKDERVVQLSQQIQSEAYFVTMFLLLTSVFVKSYSMDLPLSQYAVELGIVVLSTLYVAVRGMTVGYNFMATSKVGKTLTLSSIFIMSLIITGVTAVKNYSLYGSKYTGLLDGHFIAVIVIMFLSSIVFMSVIFALLYWLNQKGQQRIERKLNEEEEED